MLQVRQGSTRRKERRGVAARGPGGTGFRPRHLEELRQGGNGWRIHGYIDIVIRWIRAFMAPVNHRRIRLRLR